MHIKQLIEQWPWQSPRFEITSIFLVASGLISSAVLFYLFGPNGLFGLVLTLLGICYFIWYRRVAAKLRTLTSSSEKQMEFEGIVLFDFQAPGKMILEDENIRFHNILGLDLQIPCDRIESIHTKLFLNGRYMPGKRAILFVTEGYTKLVMAVAKSQSDRIKEVFKEKCG